MVRESAKKTRNGFLRPLTGSHDHLYGNSGSGLGLTICKSLTAMLGGTLHVESKENAGAEFSFTLAMDILDEEQETDTPVKSSSC